MYGALKETAKIPEEEKEEEDEEEGDEKKNNQRKRRTPAPENKQTKWNSPDERV